MTAASTSAEARLAERGMGVAGLSLNVPVEVEAVLEARDDG